MSRIYVLSCLFLLISCNDPEAQLSSLQHEFWEQFARQDFFEIQMEQEKVLLPLPVSMEAPSKQKAQAEALLKSANALKTEELSKEGQQRLQQIKTALNDFLNASGNAFFDPARYVIEQPLLETHCVNELKTRLFLERIPAYYVEVERRWQIPAPENVSRAVVKAQEGLDAIQALETSGALNPAAGAQAAKAAIKDFIGLCQSALLLK